MSVMAKVLVTLSFVEEQEEGVLLTDSELKLFPIILTRL